jgi:hypothetical protein
MKALQAAGLVEIGSKDDSAVAPTIGLVRYVASVFLPLKKPSAWLLSSQVESKQSLERFELMLQCGF